MPSAVRRRIVGARDPALGNASIPRLVIFVSPGTITAGGRGTLGIGAREGNRRLVSTSASERRAPTSLRNLWRLSSHSLRVYRGLSA
jgi:hypothetical protein